jgi:PAS domain S-box-containing protein
VTPLYIGPRHLGNIYTGQFFYDDEVVDTEAFARRADHLGFDRQAYLDALARVPRISRERVPLLMDFLVKLTVFISGQGARNLRLRHLVTTSRRMTKALRESEERLQNLCSLSPVGIFLCTPEGKYLSANQALADLLGYGSPEALMDAVDSLPERTFHDPNEWHGIVDTLETQGKFVNRLVKRHKKDGTSIWVLMNMRAVRAQDGSLSRFEGFTLDITERMLSARALAESEERLRTLINAMPDLVCFKDGQGRWLEANTFTQRLFRLGPAEYLGRTDRELARDLPGFRGTFIESAISDDLAWHAARMFRGEQAILDRGNTPRMFDIIKVPLFRADGSRRGIVTVGRDITKQRETSAALAKFNRKLESLVAERTAALEEKASELEQANARLLELDALKSSFVSSVSHEVRTPLTSILGFTRLIERDFLKHYLPLGQSSRELAAKGNRIVANLRVIDREGDRLKRLINDFLDLAKIEYGSLRWQDAWVSVGELCAQVADAVQGMFSERPELTFILDLEPDLPPVWIDPDRLQQVLFNLVGNAVKFTPAGSITLRVSKESARSLHLVLSDTGIGIEAQDLERIFEKFHQVQQSPATADQPRGTGLGLTICRQIVQHYGGTIRAESEPGQGSTFQISLPLGGEAG